MSDLKVTDRTQLNTLPSFNNKKPEEFIKDTFKNISDCFDPRHAKPLSMLMKGKEVHIYRDKVKEGLELKLYQLLEAMFGKFKIVENLLKKESVNDYFSESKNRIIEKMNDYSLKNEVDLENYFALYNEINLLDEKNTSPKLKELIIDIFSSHNTLIMTLKEELTKEIKNSATAVNNAQDHDDCLLKLNEYIKTQKEVQKILEVLNKYEVKTTSITNEIDECGRSILDAQKTTLTRSINSVLDEKDHEKQLENLNKILATQKNVQAVSDKLKQLGVETKEIDEKIETFKEQLFVAQKEKLNGSINAVLEEDEPKKKLENLENFLTIQKEVQDISGKLKELGVETEKMDESIRNFKGSILELANDNSSAKSAILALAIRGKARSIIDNNKLVNESQLRSKIKEEIEETVHISELKELLNRAEEGELSEKETKDFLTKINSNNFKKMNEITTYFKELNFLDKSLIKNQTEEVRDELSKLAVQYRNAKKDSDKEVELINNHVMKLGKEKLSLNEIRDFRYPKFSESHDTPYNWLESESKKVKSKLSKKEYNKLIKITNRLIHLKNDCKEGEEISLKTVSNLKNDLEKFKAFIREKESGFNNETTNRALQEIIKEENKFKEKHEEKPADALEQALHKIKIRELKSNYNIIQEMATDNNSNTEELEEWIKLSQWTETVLGSLKELENTINNMKPLQEEITKYKKENLLPIVDKQYQFKLGYKLIKASLEGFNQLTKV